MLHDIHSHTYYSGCGRDDPHLICDAAVKGGLELFGISDHNYGVTRGAHTDAEKAAAVAAYLDVLKGLRGEYAGRIKIACGLELRTVGDKCISDSTDLSGFDYALLENFDSPDSILYPKNGESGVFAYAKRLGCKTGIAHTDLFGFCDRMGWNPLGFFMKLADCGIFWEMNVSFDSIHGWHEHEYVKRFRALDWQRETVRLSGLEISVGFDGHRVEDYDAARVRDMCGFLDKEKIKSFNI